jgi:hypothetical protein
VLWCVHRIAPPVRTGDHWTMRARGYKNCAGSSAAADFGRARDGRWYGRASCLLPPASCLLLRPKMSVAGGAEHLRRQHVVPVETVLENLVIFKRLVISNFNPFLLLFLEHFHSPPPSPPR